jgi:hypothetical protein
MSPNNGLCALNHLQHLLAKPQLAHARRALVLCLSSAAHVLIPVHIWLKHIGADAFPL